MTTAVHDVTGAIAVAFEEQWGQIVATVIRITGDWDLAEECAQDAFAKALERWPADGIPARPGAWLTTTARNRAIDRRRRDARGRDKLAEVARDTTPYVPSFAADDREPEPIADERLRLIFTCCHPALSVEAGVAFALRSVGGLSTCAVARAFGVSEMTMSKRLVRAKDKIRNARIPFRAPPPHLIPERREAVLGVVFLMFREGHLASCGTSVMRRDLCVEAVRLTRLLAELIPGDRDVRGLLTYMQWHETRPENRAGGLPAMTTDWRDAVSSCEVLQVA